MIPQTPALLTFEEDILNSSHLHKAVAVVTKAKMSRLKLMFMTAEYKIDILQNEIRGFKGLRIFATIFIIFFFGAGLLYIIQAYHKNSSWPTYLTALTPFGMALMIYFQSKGKWIYRRFLIINSEAITWSRSTLFSPTLLYWPDIKKIQFEYTSIKFELRNGRTKSFNLTNITMQQVKELKLLFQEICVSKNIDYDICPINSAYSQNRLKHIY